MYDFDENEKIYLKEDTFYALCDEMEDMVYRANDYAPTVDEMLDVVIPHINYFSLLLIWIDETGYDTPENKESRKIVRDILKERLVLQA